MDMEGARVAVVQSGNRLMFRVGKILTDAVECFEEFLDGRFVCVRDGKFFMGRTESICPDHIAQFCGLDEFFPKETKGKIKVLLTKYFLAGDILLLECNRSVDKFDLEEKIRDWYFLNQAYYEQMKNNGGKDLSHIFQSELNSIYEQKKKEGGGMNVFNFGDLAENDKPPHCSFIHRTGKARPPDGSEGGKGMNKNGRKKNIFQEEAVLFCIRKKEEQKQVLLRFKKPEGMWDNPGRKLQNDQTHLACVEQVARGDFGLKLFNLNFAGEINIRTAGSNVIRHVVFYRANIDGIDDIEFRIEWFPTDNIPEKQLLPDARICLKQFLANKIFSGDFTYNSGQTELVHYRIHEMQPCRAATKKARYERY